MSIKPLANRRSLVIICTVLFLTFLDNTIVSVVLSNLQSNLSAGVQDLQWVVDMYMLVFAVFMLTGGTLGDLFGRKKVLLTGVALFTAGSIVAMLSQSIGMLVAGRAIMGLGAAASEPGTLSMIRHLYPDKHTRTRALGIWVAVSGVALAFGPIIGGVIIGFSNWRGVFAFSALFGLFAFVAGLKVLPESSDPRGDKLDVGGLLAGGLSLSAVIVALIMGENASYHSWWIILLLSVSLVSGIVFILIERSRKDPVLPLKFFKIPRFSLANLVAFTTNFGIFAVFFFVTLYLQLIANFSGYGIAVAFIAMTAAIVASALFAARFHTGHQARVMMIAGCLLAGGGILAVNYSIQPNITTATLAWTLALAGLGFGMCLVSMTSTVLDAVPPERSGMAASTVNTSRELGGVFGVAVLGSIVNGQLTSHLLLRLKVLGLPTNFQSFVIYAITHGGNTPQGVAVSPALLASHAQLITQVTQAAYQAFSNGLNIALNVAGGMLLATGVICAGVYAEHRRRHPLKA